MGTVLDASPIQGSVTASEYDLDYTKKAVRDQIGGMLNKMQQQKRNRVANPMSFARLPYETNESYEERMRALLPLSRQSLAQRRGYSQPVSYIGLRKNKPRGVLPTAPILPFLLYSENVQSTHFQVSESTHRSWIANPECDSIDELLD
jgi:hypothetical protein